MLVCFELTFELYHKISTYPTFIVQSTAYVLVGCNMLNGKLCCPLYKFVEQGFLCVALGE